MATFTAANAIRKISTGDESGTWGDSTNNNFDIIDRASNGFASIALTGTSFTLALSTTGVLSNGHYKAINFTGTPGGTCTVTLAQNDKPRVYMILNNTNQSVILTQGSGANVTIPTLKSAIVLANGAGSGAAVLDFTDKLNIDIDVITGVTAGTVAASKAVIVDSNKSITGFLNLTATGELDANTIDIEAGGDIKGTLNLDALDIDGAVQIDSTLTVGVDDTGYDVKFFGDTASAAMVWDASEDDLLFLGAAGLSLPDDKLTIGNTLVTVTGAEINQLANVSSAVQTQLNAKAALASPDLTGNPTAPTQTTGNDSTRIATTAFVADTAIGVGQAWAQFSSGSRGIGSAYRNTTGRPIMVSVSTNSNTEHYLQVSSDNSTFINAGTLGGHGNVEDSNSAQCIVPDDHYYRASGGSFIMWAELR